MLTTHQFRLQYAIGLRAVGALVSLEDAGRRLHVRRERPAGDTGDGAVMRGTGTVRTLERGWSGVPIRSDYAGRLRRGREAI